MKRFLKIVAILALFAVGIAYVAFRVLFFDPFGVTKAELDPLIPPDADLVLRRRDLDKDFDPFPMPRFFSALRIKDDWQALTLTKLYRENEPKLGIEALYHAAESIPEQLAPLDLMADLAGREAMVIGKWREHGQLAVAALVRASFRAKFAAEAVKFSLVRKAQGDLIQSYSEDGGVRSLKVNGQEWHLFRKDDVLVAGNDLALVQEIHGLADGGPRSMIDSPQFRAAVQAPTPIGRPLDFVLDVGDAAKQLGWKWPPAAAGDGLAYKFFRELLAPDRFNQAMGRIALGTSIELTGQVSADFPALRPAAGGLLDGQSLELEKMWRFCGSVFPQKVAVTGYVRADVRELLRRLEGLLEPDLRQLLNDTVSQMRSPDKLLQPKSTVELLDAFAGLVGNEFAFAVEPDHPYNVPGTPAEQMLIPDPNWGPRVALVFPLAEKDLAEQFVDRVWKAVSARQGAIANAWTWSYPTGEKFREIKTVDNDMPTISIGFLKLQQRECVVLTTTGKFLDEIVNQKAAAEAGTVSGLMSELQYKQAEDALKGFGQGFVFTSGANLREVIYNLCPVFAANATRPDWAKVRREVTVQMLQKKFPNLAGRNDEASKKLVEADVDAEIERREKEWREVELDKATEALRHDLGALSMLRWATFAWRVNDRDLEARLRLSTPANFPND